MKSLKLIGLTFLRLVKQTWSLPRTISNALKRSKERTILQGREAERLDRIRNPLKYLGK